MPMMPIKLRPKARARRWDSFKCNHCEEIWQLDLRVLTLRVFIPIGADHWCADIHRAGDGHTWIQSGVSNLRFTTKKAAQKAVEIAALKVLTETVEELRGVMRRTR